MSIQTKKQIENRRWQLNAKLEYEESRFKQIKRNIRVVTTIVAFLCAIGYVFAFFDEQYWLAVALAGLSAIAVSIALTVKSAGSQSYVFFGFLVSSIIAVMFATSLAVSLKDTFVPTIGASVDYIPAFVKFSISIIQIVSITVISMVLVVFADRFSEVKLEKIRSTIDELKSQLEQLEFLSPDAHSECCLQYAEWVEHGDALALELHNNLDGRKPTVGEFIELSEKIAERDKPESDENRARKACERLFVG
jgi:hypothetical protein